MISMRTSSSISSTGQMPPLAEETNRLLADFLRIDAQVALTFSGIALSTTDLAKRERTTKIARKAYDTVLRLKPGVRMTHDTEERLTHDLRQLEIELEVLGEAFSTASVQG